MRDTRESTTAIVAHALQFLLFPQFKKSSAGGVKFFKTSFFSDFAVFYHDDSVHFAHGGEAVRNAERGDGLKKLMQRCPDFLF